MTKYSEYGSPAACTYSPVVKTGTESETEDMQMEKAANRHLPIPVSSPRLSRATGGMVSVDYHTVSGVVIKPNQETQTRETNREQSGGRKSSEAEQGVCDREEEKKKQF